jgi:hypothetical protein
VLKKRSVQTLQMIIFLKDASLKKAGLRINSLSNEKVSKGIKKKKISRKKTNVY